jgi:hypothetical protein
MHEDLWSQPWHYGRMRYLNGFAMLKISVLQ